MPPKRKLRPSTVEQPSSDPAPSTSPSAQPDPLPKPDNTNTAAGTSTSNNLLNDPWTDEQEIALLKALVRWKPVGMHKHFRMISIANYMSAQPCVKPEADEHCKVPGIWEKLGQLYNLAVLDEREDSSLASPPPQSPEPRDAVKPHSNSTFQEFALPSGFRDMMFERRLAPEGSKSPPLSARSVKSSGRSTRRESTVQDSEEPRSSPAPATTGGRGGRRGRRSTRAIASERAAVAAQREADEVEEVDEEQEQEEGEGSGEEEEEGDSDDEEEVDEEGEEDEGDEGEGEVEEQEEEASEEQQNARTKRKRTSGAATPSSTRGRGGARGRGRGRGRGRR